MRFVVTNMTITSIDVRSGEKATSKNVLIELHHNSYYYKMTIEEAEQRIFFIKMEKERSNNANHIGINFDVFKDNTIGLWYVIFVPDNSENPIRIEYSEEKFAIFMADFEKAIKIAKEEEEKA